MYRNLKEREGKIRQQMADNPEKDQVRKFLESRGVKYSKLDVRNPSFPKSLLPIETEKVKEEPKAVEAKKEEKKAAAHH